MIIIKTHLGLKYVRNTDNQNTIYNRSVKFSLRNGKCLHLNLIIIFHKYQSPLNHCIYSLVQFTLWISVQQFEVKKAKDLAIESNKKAIEGEVGQVERVAWKHIYYLM